MAETQLNSVNPNRSREEHEGWTSTLVASTFLGCDKPWEKLQFCCMLEGFMAPLKGAGRFTVAEVDFATTLMVLLTDLYLALARDRLRLSVGNNPVLIQLPGHHRCGCGTAV